MSHRAAHVSKRWSASFAVATLLFLTRPATADDKPKKPDEKPTPQVTLALPLGMAAGATTKIVIRGIKLDQASEVQFVNYPAKTKILSKGKTGVPDKVDPKKAGDTQVEVEIAVPPDAAPGPTNFVVVTPDGKTPPHPLLVAAKGALDADRKASGFRDAQPVAFGHAIDGVIESQRQAHVYRLDGHAKQKIAAEVIAARQGSLLDSMLTLYDSAGHIVAVNDDSGGSADSRIEVVLPTTGPYYLSLIDAQDTGGPLHVFRLLVEAK